MGLFPYELSRDAPQARTFSGAEIHNTPSFAGMMRYAPLLADLLDYAMELCELDGGGLTDIHITHLDSSPFAVVPRMVPEGSGRETARLAYALVHDDARRRQVIHEWGKRLTLSEQEAAPADPRRFFYAYQIHCHDSPIG